MMGDKEVIRGIIKHQRNLRYQSIAVVLVMLVIAGAMVLRIWGVI